MDAQDFEYEGFLDSGFRRNDEKIDHPNCNAIAAISLVALAGLPPYTAGIPKIADGGQYE